MAEHDEHRRGIAAVLIGALLGALLSVALTSPVRAAPLCAEVSSQSWWTQKGEAFPGRHIHVETCFPLNQIIAGPSFDLNVTVRLHGQPGKVTMLRAQTFGTTQNVSTTTVPMSFSCASADCSTQVPIRVNLPKDGRWEIRLTANIKSNVFGKRQYQTTRWHVCARTCSGGGQPLADRFGAAGWYQGLDYQNVRIRSADGMRLAFSPLTTPTTIQVWGEDQTLSVHIDPDMHAGDRGLVLFDGAGGQVWRNVTIPALAPGTHRLVIVGGQSNSTGVSNGVFGLSFTVAP